MLDDNKIIAWFGQNNDTHFHSKFYPIPIGIADQHWPHGNPHILNTVRSQIPSIRKNMLVYINFLNSTNRRIRDEVERIFSEKNFCYRGQRKSWHDYLIDIAQSKFVISPHGNGLDCHRTWEALLMGSIPIVKTSSLDSLYEDLPVVIIKEWQEVTEDFLNKKYEEMMLKSYKKEKIFAEYWINLILKMREFFLAQDLKA